MKNNKQDNNNKVVLVKPVVFAKEKNIRPQMIFSWIRNKTLVVRSCNEETGREWLVSREDVERRYQQYLQNAKTRLENVQKYLVK